MTNEVKVRDSQEIVANQDLSELKSFIDKRKEEVQTYYISRFSDLEGEEINGIPAFEIQKHLFSPLLAYSSVARQYSALDLLIVLEYYQEQLIEINKAMVYPPTLEQYCRLLGISTRSFKLSYVNSQDPVLCDAAQQVIDFMSGALNSAGMNKQIDSTSQIFAQKSQLGKRDTSEQPTQHINNNIVITSEEFKREMSKIVGSK